MIQVQFEKSRVFAAISGDESVVLAANVIQQAHTFMLGSGITSYEIERRKGLDERCILDFTCISKPKPFAFSSTAKISTLNENGYFPHSLVSPWDSGFLADINSRSDNVSGQKRFSLNKDDGGVIMQMRDLDLNFTISDYSYSISDIITGFLVRGVTQAKHQASVELAQTWLNVTMSEQEMHDYFNNRYDYDPNMIIKNIPSTYQAFTFKSNPR